MSSFSIIIKWSNKELPIEVAEDNTVYDLKRKIKDATNVEPKRQKLLGLKAAGKPPQDDAKIKDLQLKNNQKIIMMGTPEEQIEEVPPDIGDDVVDDFETSIEEIDVKDHQDNLRKIQNRIEKLQITVFTPPRTGKKLLVLDIDYTLMDHKSTVERPEELMRPYLHQFLTSAYEHYDIIIWSATSMKWIELKMKELGVSTNPNFKIVCYLDQSAMITVSTTKYGVYNAKPLGVIWGKFSEFYNPANTIMFDDLGRNFIMNPQSGLKIRPFKNAPLTRHEDNELQRLEMYLRLINSLTDFSKLDHKEWEHYVKKHAK